MNGILAKPQTPLKKNEDAKTRYENSSYFNKGDKLANGIIHMPHSGSPKKDSTKLPKQALMTA